MTTSKPDGSHQVNITLTISGLSPEDAACTVQAVKLRDDFRRAANSLVNHLTSEKIHHIQMVNDPRIRDPQREVQDYRVSLLKYFEGLL